MSLEALFDRYVAERRAGGDPDPVAYLDEAGADREALAAMIAVYALGNPRRDIPETDLDARMAALQAAEPWEALLPRLREAAALPRGELVRRLAARLGFPGEERRVEEYVHRLETGRLSPRGVRAPVVAALAELLGVGRELLARAAEAGSAPRPGPAPVYGRSAARALRADAAGAGLPADGAAEAGQAPPDALDDLFTGGDA